MKKRVSKTLDDDLKYSNCIKNRKIPNVLF